MLKSIGLFFSKTHLLRAWSFLCLLNSIGAFTLSQLIKLTSRKLELWVVLWSFFLQRLLSISINVPYNLQGNIFVMSGQVYKTVGPSFVVSLKLLNHHYASSLSLFYRYYFGKCSSEPVELVPLPYLHGRSTCYSDRLHDISVTITWCYKDVCVNSLFLHTARPWNPLLIKFVPLIYGLSDFKSRISRHLLSVSSFQIAFW